MSKLLLPCLVLLAACAACENRTVVYHSPRGADQTVVHHVHHSSTRTVYVDRETDKHPTSLPGAARRVPDAGEPDKFEAAAPSQ